jgi:ATP-dependent Clp protease ATP-binding subunit ClpA
MDRETLVTRYKEAIEDHFTVALNRPELLNRLGDNIVVFNYISPEVGKRILAMQLGNVARRIEQEYKARLEISATAIGQVEELALADLDLGGRGIGSIVESVLVNPLARAIFSEPPAAGDLVIVEELRHVGTNWELVLR